MDPTTKCSSEKRVWCKPELRKLSVSHLTQSGATKKSSETASYKPS
jgi:hypothetical protein